MIVNSAGRGLAGEFTIVRDGQPKAVIVVQKKQSETTVTAARDLQQYVQQISGATLPIFFGEGPKDGQVIFVGDGPKVRQLAGSLLTEEHLGSDGYVLQTRYWTYESARTASPDRLVVAGRGDGTRFAVFALLEKLGCRFFHCGPDGEHVPRQKDLAVGCLGVVSKPDFVWRSLWVSGGTVEQAYGRDADGEAWRSWQSWCVKHKVGGDGLDIGHNFQVFCPPSLFQEHPEYFSLARPGSQLFDAYASEEQKKAGQPIRVAHLRCLSNAAVLQLAIEGARKSFVGGAASYSLSPDDASRWMWCQCDPCRAMDGPNDNVHTRLLRFANQVAEALEPDFPGRLLPFYCQYGIPGEPPAHRDGSLMLKAHPMVTPVPVNIYCRLHYINSPQCSYSFRWPLAVWSRAAERIYVRGYRMWSRYPAPGTWTAGPLIRYLRDSGVKGYNCEILGRSPDNDLALYVIAKMLWNCDQDPDALVEEYFQLYFQEAAPEMKAYYHCLNDSVLKQSKWHSDQVFEQASVFTDDLVSRLDRNLRLAEQKAEKEIVKRRVERERLALTSFDHLRRVEQLYMEWTHDQDPRKAKTLDVLIDEGLQFTEKLDGKFIVNQYGQRRFYELWREKIDNE
ncbi:MAG: DUF4838 domain-containing protein [Planctomycetes bacterium]|nr:DUF4838 domain-containing protein [Planctomycetota bacterium]